MMSRPQPEAGRWQQSSRSATASWGRSAALARRTDELGAVAVREPSGDERPRLPVSADMPTALERATAVPPPHRVNPHVKHVHTSPPASAPGVQLITQGRGRPLADVCRSQSACSADLGRSAPTPVGWRYPASARRTRPTGTTSPEIIALLAAPYPSSGGTAPARCPPGFARQSW
jgi:hypothetical protein